MHRAESSHCTPRRNESNDRAPIAEWRATIERMQIQQLIRKPCVGEDFAFNAPLCANAKRLHVGGESDNGARNGQTWIEVSTGPATSEEHRKRLLCDHRDAATHDQAPAGESGSVASVPYTRSFSLPMLMSM